VKEFWNEESGNFRKEEGDFKKTVGAFPEIPAFLLAPFF